MMKTKKERWRDSVEKLLTPSGPDEAGGNGVDAVNYVSTHVVNVVATAWSQEAPEKGLLMRQVAIQEAVEHLHHLVRLAFVARVGLIEVG